MKKKWISHSVEDTYHIAREVAAMIENKKISPWIFLKGDIGSGKTTFVRGFLSFWDITEGISSPTFSIVHHYPHSQKSIYHIDLYRLHSQEEIEDIGLYDLFKKDTIVLIEWPEVIELSFFLPLTKITFSYGEKEHYRHILLISENS